MYCNLLLGIGGEAIPHGDDNPSTTDIIPTMTSNTAPSGVASASSEFSATYAAWVAMDDLTTLATHYFWQTSSTTTGHLQYQLASAKAVNKYTVAMSKGAESVTTRMAKDWTLEASNTGAFAGEEVVLDTVTGETAWSYPDVRTFTFANGSAYLYYRLVITANNGDATYLLVGQMELIESQ